MWVARCRCGCSLFRSKHHDDLETSAAQHDFCTMGHGGALSLAGCAGDDRRRRAVQRRQSHPPYCCDVMQWFNGKPRGAAGAFAPGVGVSTSSFIVSSLAAALSGPGVLALHAALRYSTTLQSHCCGRGSAARGVAAHWCRGVGRVPRLRSGPRALSQWMRRCTARPRAERLPLPSCSLRGHRAHLTAWSSSAAASAAM
jgi:hypothetical protein